jgi:hypothetical protein
MRIADWGMNGGSREECRELSRSEQGSRGGRGE